MVKNLSTNAGDVRDAGSTPGSGRTPGGGYGNPLQYSFLENPMDRGAWRATIYRITVKHNCSNLAHTHTHTHTHTHFLIISVSQMRTGRHKEVRWALQGSHPPSPTNTHWKEVQLPGLQPGPPTPLFPTCMWETLGHTTVAPARLGWGRYSLSGGLGVTAVGSNLDPGSLWGQREGKKSA